MSDNKPVKTIMDAVTLTSLDAGIGWIAKKVVKGNITSDSNSNFMNNAKFTAVMAGSVALKQYLEDQKILPTKLKNKHIATPKKKHDGKHCNYDRRRSS